MTLSREIMIEIMATSDRSYDGKFLVGVMTTGIYCLPSCPARTPKPENIQFFSSELEAQSKGLRACKRCRPSDFYQNFDPDLDTIVWPNGADFAPEFLRSSLRVAA